MQEMTFATRLQDVFGFKPGQSMTEFMQELKALDAADREYFSGSLRRWPMPISN